ncbi:uncharacterized protein LOC144110706 [Amblyomma americanum]
MERKNPGSRSQQPATVSKTAKTRDSPVSPASSPLRLKRASDSAKTVSSAGRSAAKSPADLVPVATREVVEADDADTKLAEASTAAVVVAAASDADAAAAVVPVPHAALVPVLDGCLVESPATEVADPTATAAAGTSGGSPTMDSAWNWTTSRASSTHTSRDFAKLGTNGPHGWRPTSLPARATHVSRGTYHANAYPCDTCGYHFDVRMNRRQAFLDWFRDERNLGHHVLFGMSLLLATSLSLALTLSWLEASRRMANLSLLLSVPLGLALLLHSCVWASLAVYGLWQYPKAYLRWKNETLPMVSQHIIRMTQTCGPAAGAQSPQPETAYDDSAAGP